MVYSTILSQERVLFSVIFTRIYIFYFPGYNAIVLKSGNIETVFLSQCKCMYDPSIFGHGFPKTEARILGFGNVGVRNTELVTEFTGDQMEMINETIIEAITGAIIAMITELTGDYIGD